MGSLEDLHHEFGDRKQNPMTVNTALTFTRWPEAKLQTNDTAAP